MLLENSMKKRFKDIANQYPCISATCWQGLLIPSCACSSFAAPSPPQEPSATVCLGKSRAAKTHLMRLDLMLFGLVGRKARPRGMQMCHQKPGLASECSSEWPADASCRPQATEKSTVTQPTLCNRSRAVCLYISLCPHTCSTVDLNYKIKMFTMLCNRSGRGLLILHGDILPLSA